MGKCACESSVVRCSITPTTQETFELMDVASLARVSGLFHSIMLLISHIVVVPDPRRLFRIEELTEPSHSA